MCVGIHYLCYDGGDESLLCDWCSGVRTFCPKPVAKVMMNVGGTASLLGLVAMASDIEGLYASVKALVCVVRSNKLAAKEMDRIKGYQVQRRTDILHLGLVNVIFTESCLLVVSV